MSILFLFRSHLAGLRRELAAGVVVGMWDVGEGCEFPCRPGDSFALPVLLL